MAERMELGAEIQVWHGDVGADGTLRRDGHDADLAILSVPERARCQRLVRPIDQFRFAAQHADARRLLAEYLGVSPAIIRFGRTPCCRCGQTEHGPPRIDWPRTDITFNQSASEGQWLLAVARNRRVGIDIEVSRDRDIDVSDLARACMTDTEQRYLNAGPQADRQRRFYQCWTRKEAVLKACGVGLAGALSELDTEPARDGGAEIQHQCGAGPGRWAVQDLAPERGSARPDLQPEMPGWIGALAQPADGAVPVWLREWWVHRPIGTIHRKT